MALMIVEYWPRGYAHETGLKRVELEQATEAEYLVAIRGLAPSNNFASIYNVREKNPAPVAPVSEEYARMMSRNDNS